jgi:hypothetical protein
VTVNGKVHEGLSEEGLIAHIANTIGLWRGTPSIGTRNDCKSLVSHAVRRYRVLLANRNQTLPTTRINRIVNGLLAMVEPDASEPPISQVRRILDHALPGNGFDGKSYERLSTDGLLAHIVNTIGLWKTAPRIGTPNDCKLIVSRAVRDYQTVLHGRRPALLATPKARARLEKGLKVVCEHVIPANCVVNALMDLVDAGDVAMARDILSRGTRLAWVAADEHDALIPYQHDMPNGATYPWPNVWARYLRLDVPLPTSPLIAPGRCRSPKLTQS